MYKRQRGSFVPNFMFLGFVLSEISSSVRQWYLDFTYVDKFQSLAEAVVQRSQADELCQVTKIDE